MSLEPSPDKRERFLRVVGELMPRINEAIGRITSGEAAMRIPVDKTDPDIVLGECSNALAYARDHLACAPFHVAPSGSVADLCANIVTDMLGNEKGEQIATRIRASFPSATLWKPWDGTYEKQFYDVRYDRCKVQLHCWPNAGKMVAVDGSGLKWGREDAVEVRVSEFQMLPPALCDVAPNNSPDGSTQS